MVAGAGGRVKQLLARGASLVRPLVGVLIIAAVVYAVVSQWSEVRHAITDMAWQSVLLAWDRAHLCSRSARSPYPAGTAD